MIMDKLNKSNLTPIITVSALCSMILVTLFTILITYPHHSHFGRLSGIIIDDSKLTWFMDILFPFIIDLPILITGMTLLVSGFAGLSDKFQKNIRTANILFMILSSAINYIIVFSGMNDIYSTIPFFGLSTKYIWSLAGIIAPLALWGLSEMFFTLIKEFTLKDDTSKTVEQLLDKEAGLKTKVTLLAQELNGMETDRQNHDKFIKVAAKEKSRYEEIMATFKDEIYKNEALKKSLSIEVAQLNKDKSILQNWFKALSSSDAQSKKTRSEVKHRRAEIVKEIVKNGASANIVNNDMNIIEAKVDSNGYA